MKTNTALFLLLIGGCYLASLFYYAPWRWAVVGGGDPWGYYVYLPAAFLHHDLASLEKTVAVRRQYRPETVVPTPENLLGIEEAHLTSTGKGCS